MSCCSDRGAANMRSPGSWRNRRASTKLYAAPGNPGIARHAELVALDPADHRGGDRFLPAPFDRPRRDRARSAAGRRPCRQSARRWASRCSGPTRRRRSSKDRRASPRICARARTSRPPAMPASRSRDGALAALDDFGAAGGDQGRRPRRRQGRDDRDHAAPKPRPRSTRSVRRTRGGEAVIEEFLTARKPACSC